jgi:methylenetetrahydrofolate dehydrogenase (NADP+) / methenyltetrahydrofolate cyclohydrolase
MTAQRVDGKLIAARIKARLRAEVAALEGRIPPIRLVSIEVGDNPAAALYVRNQQRAAEAIGVRFEHLPLPGTIPEDDLIAFVRGKSEDPLVTGIILQRPLPAHLHTRRIHNKIHPDKDVEGLNPANMGFIVINEPKLVPCTALAAVKVLLSTGIDPRGKETVVIGHSDIVGKPIAFLMLNLAATVTVCHVDTQDLAAHTKKAEIVFVAVGKPGLVRGEMLRPGATVLDIGINQVPVLTENGAPAHDASGQPLYKVCGDVDYASAEQVAGAITPVPGGIGPVTVMTLLSNAVTAARLQHRAELGPYEPDPLRMD